MNKTIMQKITPYLWFNNNAEAAEFYTSIFKNSKLVDIVRYGKAAAKVSRRAQGTIMTVMFELEGQLFIALNGGPVFKFSPAISFLVHSRTQKELDYLYDKLSAGGEIEQCGWLKDKYGVSWQIVPIVLIEMLQVKDVKKSESHEGDASNEENRYSQLKEAYMGNRRP
jgi:predicted 3-demethylubiquinone-9 3-methyltransferase (glyoxalase superfamily)